MLVDLLGYFKRNARKMNEFEIKKSLNEIRLIQAELEKSLKTRGVV